MKNKVEPKDYRELAWNKKVDLLSKLFISFCTNDKLFTKKGLAPSYFMLRRFFEKRTVPELHLLYDYVYSFDKKKIMTLSEFIQGTERFRVRKIMQDNKAKIEKAEDNYGDFSLRDLEGLL